MEDDEYDQDGLSGSESYSSYDYDSSSFYTESNGKNSADGMNDYMSEDEYFEQQ